MNLINNDYWVMLHGWPYGSHSNWDIDEGHRTITKVK